MTKRFPSHAGLRIAGTSGYGKSAATWSALSAGPALSVVDGWAPTADETCPACGAPTESRYADSSGVLPVVEAEACTSCGWVAEFTEGGEAA